MISPIQHPLERVEPGMLRCGALSTALTEPRARIGAGCVLSPGPREVAFAFTQPSCPPKSRDSLVRPSRDTVLAAPLPACRNDPSARRRAKFGKPASAGQRQQSATRRELAENARCHSAEAH